MENQTFIYEHPKFGNLRVRIIDGNPKFVVADACRALGIKNYRDAVSRLDDDEKDLVEISISPTGVALTDTQGGYQKMLVVNEPGLYRLIFSSRKKESKEFQRWVYHEVLPSIRKYGYYSLTAETAPVATKPAKNPKRSHGQKSHARTYVFLMVASSFFVVKIGISKDVDARKKKIQQETNATVCQIYKTSLLPRQIARLLENLCKEHFSSFRLSGERYEKH